MSQPASGPRAAAPVAEKNQPRPRHAGGMTAAVPGGVSGVCPLRQLVCLQSPPEILPPSGLARDLCDPVQSHAGRQEAIPMAPCTPASAVSARAAGRCRPTTPDLSGPDPAREADQVVV